MSARTRILGVDYGTVRIGLAVSDPDRKIASPLKTYQRRGREADAEFFRELIQEELIERIVVGLPVHLSGREGQKAAETREFGEWLGELTGLPIVFADERFTSVEAEAALWAADLTHKQRKQRRDRVAAQILLQGYLEAEPSGKKGAGPLGD